MTDNTFNVWYLIIDKSKSDKDIDILDKKVSEIQIFLSSSQKILKILEIIKAMFILSFYKWKYSFK